MQTRIKIIKNRSLDVQKGANNEVTFMLYCTALCPVLFHLSPGNFHNASRGRKLIESIYSKSNSYLLVDRAYEDDKTIAFAKTHDFHPVITSKKNRKSHGLHDK